MANNKNGFTLIEVLVVLSLFALIGSIVISVPINMYHRMLLKSAAVEVKEALYLSQQLSLDESKSYCVELLGNKLEVREDIIGGKPVLTRKFDKGISMPKGPKNEISYNRNGETNYGEFILINKKGQRIAIEVLIGTGRVNISDIF